MSTATRIVAGVVLAWVGMTLHDLAELPQLVPGDPQFTIPSAIFLALGIAWLARPGRLTRGLLIAWGLLNLLGAIVTVLPLPFLPFQPEQSLQHYAVHLLYTATQVPLLAMLLGRESAGRRAG